MDFYESLRDLFELFAQDLGVDLQGWSADSFEVSVKGDMDCGRIIENFGDGSSIFSSMSQYERMLAHSVVIPLDGGGRSFQHLLGRDPVPMYWTLPQQRVVAVFIDVVDGLIDGLKKDVERINDFFYIANDESGQPSPNVPAALERWVWDIELSAPGREYIALEEDQSFSEDVHADEIVDEVIAGSWRIATIQFCCESGATLSTNGPVAWPVAEEEAFLTRLFHRLSPGVIDSLDPENLEVTTHDQP